MTRGTLPSPFLDTKMDLRPWLERWETGRIGFHRDDVHPRLRAHWPGLGLRGDERVFVPLCGKSLDMRWLAERGHAVLGVEASPLAAGAFFEEWGRAAEVRHQDRFEIHRAAEVEIWVGDVFDLRAEQLADVGAYYDRASLVALDAADRRAFAAHLARILPAGTRGLLVGLEYPEGAMTGPPYTVDEEELRALLDPVFERRRLARQDASEDESRLAERLGAPVVEHVHRLVRRAA